MGFMSQWQLRNEISEQFLTQNLLLSKVYKKIQLKAPIDGGSVNLSDIGEIHSTQKLLLQNEVEMLKQQKADAQNEVEKLKQLKEVQQNEVEKSKQPTEEHSGLALEVEKLKQQKADLALEVKQVKQQKADEQNDFEKLKQQKADDLNKLKQQPKSNQFLSTILHKDQGYLNIFVTMCGDSDALVLYGKAMALSLATQSSAPIHMHILNDNNPVLKTRLFDPLQDMVDNGLIDPKRFKLSLPLTTVPPEKKHIFKICAFSRLLLEHEFPDISKGIYVDVDTIVHGDIAELFLLFEKFSATQWAGLALESEPESVSTGPNYYQEGLVQGPWYTPNGINSGVLMFDMEKWKKTGFTTFAASYTGHQPLGDQDIINAYFAAHREEIYELPCQWNLRSDSKCPGLDIRQPRGKDVFTAGIVHGNRGLFLDENQPNNSLYALLAWFHGMRNGVTCRTCAV